MPELPEVETVVRTLEKSLKSEIILDVNMLYPKLLETGSDYQIDHLIGRRFVMFSRRGKYLCFGLDDGVTWVVHLRMEGKFNLYQKETPITKHTHMVLKTENHWVHYMDTRKFSRMALVKDLDAYFKTKGLGLEPWDEAFDARYLYDAIRSRKQAIKAVLLDQGIVVGLGNIYADEVLFDARIHPKTPASSLTLSQCKKLVPIIQDTLQNAIDAGGTTVRSYTSSLDVSGRFQINLKAYGRYGEPCMRCGRTLDKVKVAGRTSVFCINCQKVKL